MHTQEQIELLLQAMLDAQPKDLARFMSENQAGTRAVLRLLYASNEVMTAGKIAQQMGVSGARVAVLLKKMAAKNLIVKEAAPDDARVTTVRLTQHGMETAKIMRQELFDQIGNVIDKVGMDAMLEFVRISRQIQESLTPSTIPI